MSTITTADIFDALAVVIDKRSRRRGRKPPWNILVWTDEKGIVHVVDVNTDCKTTCGKRHHTKHSKVHAATPTNIDPVTGKRKYTKRNTVTVPATETHAQLVSEERISPITGKPVRKYAKRNSIPTATIDDAKVLEDDTNKNMVMLAEAKVKLAQLKLVLEGAKSTNDTKKIAIIQMAIKVVDAKVNELNKFVNA